MTNKTDKTIDKHEMLKYEIAEELGLLDKVNQTGWKSLTAKESGRIGGIMTKRMKEHKEDLQAQTNDPRM